MSSLKVSSIEGIKININPEYVLRRLGKRKDTKVGSWKEKIKEMIEEARIYINPKINYTDMRVKRVNDNEIILENLKIESEMLSRVLKKSIQVTLFISTIGGELKKSSVKEKRTPADMVILDAIGSEAAESTVRWFHRNVGIKAKKRGYRVTGRFSPGYGDFDIHYQKWFVENLKGRKIGVGYSENFVLIPEKSVTGVIGWRK